MIPFGAFKKMIRDWAAVLQMLFLKIRQSITGGTLEFCFIRSSFTQISGGMDVVIELLLCLELNWMKTSSAHFLRCITDFGYRWAYHFNLDEGLCFLSGDLIRLDG